MVATFGEFPDDLPEQAVIDLEMFEVDIDAFGLQAEDARRCEVGSVAAAHIEDGAHRGVPQGSDHRELA